jgi:kinetochor protein Mis14/NSL1
MADVHRKIELQEQDDLRYLINNARRRATEKIDQALPPIEGEDALRRRVEELVHEVSFCLPPISLFLFLQST